MRPTPPPSSSGLHAHSQGRRPRSLSTVSASNTTLPPRRQSAPSPFPQPPPPQQQQQQQQSRSPSRQGSSSGSGVSSGRASSASNMSRGVSPSAVSGSGIRRRTFSSNSGVTSSAALSNKMLHIPSPSHGGGGDVTAEASMLALAPSSPKRVARQGVSLEQFSCPLELELEDTDAEALLMELGGGDSDDDDDRERDLLHLDEHDGDGVRRRSSDVAVSTWMRGHSREGSSSRGHSRQQSEVFHQKGFVPKPTYKRFNPQAPPPDFAHLRASPKTQPISPTTELPEELPEEPRKSSSKGRDDDDDADESMEAPEPSGIVLSHSFRHVPESFHIGVEGDDDTDNNNKFSSARLRKNPSLSIVTSTDDLANSSSRQHLAAPAAPAWPEFSPKLAETVAGSGGAAGGRTFNDLLFSVPDAVLSAAQTVMAGGGAKQRRKRKRIGTNNVQELMDSTNLDQRPVFSSDDDFDDDDDDDDIVIEEEEEMMETVEAGPVRSHTHVPVAATPAPDTGSRKQYYFEKKQLLDKDAGTLENAAPAIVSAAVRAQQSPFAPWFSFLDDAIAASDSSFPAEIEKLVESSYGAPAEGGNVMATPLSANKLWISSNVRYHPLDRSKIIINPAINVPEFVRLHMPDAARKNDTFKSVTVRGKPKFERGSQTTLTHYHEVKVFWDICKVALLQRESLGRLGISSERSLSLIHTITLEQYNRQVLSHNIDTAMKQFPQNVLSMYYGALRERKGQRRMLQDMLDVPTADGRTLKQILDEDQAEDFERAIALSARLIDETAEFVLPLQQLVKMEGEARRQEERCCEAWVASMEHLAVLIGMSCARRASVRVKKQLSTKTDLDEKITTVAAALKKAARADNGGE